MLITRFRLWAGFLRPRVHGLHGAPKLWGGLVLKEDSRNLSSRQVPVCLLPSLRQPVTLLAGVARPPALTPYYLVGDRGSKGILAMEKGSTTALGALAAVARLGRVTFQARVVLFGRSTVLSAPPSVSSPCQRDDAPTQWGSQVYKL